MTFKRPTVAELKAIGAAVGHQLDDGYAGAMLAGMAPLFGSFEVLDREADELPAVRYPERSHRFPRSGENPLGAWYVKTAIEGSDGGPLKGRTVAIKDSIFVAGVPMMCGASVLEGFVPDFDATVVTRLLDAGAVITGKAVCEYLCVSGGSFTSSTGVVDNPWKRGYSAGGSSSGSAALVAAGDADLALGGDQAGSIRIPSSWCGTCGMKPTHGLVPYTGVMSVETSIDHIGPITSNVADNALMLEVLAGYDELDGRQQHLVLHRYTGALDQSIAGVRIGVVEEGFGLPSSDAAVDDCVRAAAARLHDLGAAVERVSIPAHLSGLAIWGGIVADALWQTLKLNGLGCNYSGVYSPALFAAADKLIWRLDEMPPNVRMLVLLGKYLETYNGYYYCKAKNLARRLRAAYDAALSRCDLLLMPTTPRHARRNPESLADASIEEILEHATVNVVNTAQFNVTGHPSLSLPCGLRDGLPIGMMLTGRHFEEPAIYRVAHAFERSLDWRTL
jgi:amidase